MNLAHAIQSRIMLVSLFKYICARVDASLPATIYIARYCWFQFISQGHSMIVGKMYDQLVLSLSYKILDAVVSFFVIVSYLVLTNIRRETHQEAATS